MCLFFCRLVLLYKRVPMLSAGLLKKEKKSPCCVKQLFPSQINSHDFHTYYLLQRGELVPTETFPWPHGCRFNVCKNQSVSIKKTVDESSLSMTEHSFMHRMLIPLCVSISRKNLKEAVCFSWWVMQILHIFSQFQSNYNHPDARLPPPYPPLLFRTPPPHQSAFRVFLAGVNRSLL